MNGSMHESEPGVTVAQTFNSSDAPVNRTIIYDPEHPAGIIVGRSGHDLLDEAIKRIDAILGFAATEDSRVMNVQTRNTATYILRPVGTTRLARLTRA